jgi:uncharacterized protein with gpF-like domain
MTAGAEPPLKTTFVEEQHLALRVPQVQFPIRQSEWGHLRLILLRCKSRERSFEGSLWGTTSIAISATLATFGFMLVKATPEWIMRTSIAIATAAGVAAVILAIVQRLVRIQKVTSIDDALEFMEECEHAFAYNGVDGSASTKT